MNAFLTGSRAYGTPYHDSDVDLVVYLKKAEIDVLVSLGSDHSRGSGTALGNVSLRFGRLNLICLTDPTDYGIWVGRPLPHPHDPVFGARP